MHVLIVSLPGFAALCLDLLDFLIAALSAPQRTVEKLLESVQSSNERIEELTDKVNALDSDVKLLSRSDIMLRKLISQSMVVAVE